MKSHKVALRDARNPCFALTRLWDTDMGLRSHQNRVDLVLTLIKKVVGWHSKGQQKISHPNSFFWQFRNLAPKILCPNFNKQKSTFWKKTFFSNIFQLSNQLSKYLQLLNFLISAKKAPSFSRFFLIIRPFKTPKTDLPSSAWSPNLFLAWGSTFRWAKTT